MDFDDAQLRRLDLTLLLVFEEAMTSRKLSAAAKRLGLTQSAISHALKRLRDVFHDELFVRTSRGVQPTPRALALRRPLTEALRLIDGAVRPAGFDPERDERTFRIAAPDYETSLFAPSLLKATRDSALRFIFRGYVRRAAIAALQAGDLDLVLGYTWDKGEGCDAERLYHENYLVLARRGHPALRGRLNLSRYTQYPHVLVSPGGVLSGIVDFALEQLHLSRRVVLAVPYFFAALTVVAETDMIVTLPRRVARGHAARFGLQAVEPPLELRSFPVQMAWNRRFGGDPALLWLRGKMQRTSEKLLS